MRPDAKTIIPRPLPTTRSSDSAPSAIGPHGRVLVIGFDGGVGRAVMGALARTSLGHRITGAITELVLLDADPAQRRLPLHRVRHLPRAPSARARSLPSSCAATASTR